MSKTGLNSPVSNKPPLGSQHMLLELSGSSVLDTFVGIVQFHPLHHILKLDIVEGLQVWR